MSRSVPRCNRLSSGKVLVKTHVDDLKYEIVLSIPTDDLSPGPPPAPTTDRPLERHPGVYRFKSPARKEHSECPRHCCCRENAPLSSAAEARSAQPSPENSRPKV